MIVQLSCVSVKPEVERSLAILADVVENVNKDGCSTSRKLLWESLQRHVTTTLHVFPIFIHQSDTAESVLNFILVVLQGAGVSWNSRLRVTSHVQCAVM